MMVMLFMMDDDERKPEREMNVPAVFCLSSFLFFILPFFEFPSCPTAGRGERDGYGMTEPGVG